MPISISDAKSELENNISHFAPENGYWTVEMSERIVSLLGLDPKNYPRVERI
jgi:hypothetical protein